MKKQLSVCLAVLAMSFAACGGDKDNKDGDKAGDKAADKASDKGTDGDKGIEGFVKLDTEKGKAFAIGGDDCAAKAKAVGDWRTKNTKNYNEMRKGLAAKYKKGPPEEHKAQLNTNKKAVMDAMMKCTSDPAFSKMMDETKI